MINHIPDESEQQFVGYVYVQRDRYFAPNVVASFECKLDMAMFATCTSPVSLTMLADGSHTFMVRAKDANGNVDPTPASFTWVVDTTAPDTSITMMPTDPTTSTNASFSFTGK